MSSMRGKSPLWKCIFTQKTRVFPSWEDVKKFILNGMKSFYGLLKFLDIKQNSSQEEKNGGEKKKQKSAKKEKDTKISFHPSIHIPKRVTNQRTRHFSIRARRPQLTSLHLYSLHTVFCSLYSKENVIFFPTTWILRSFEAIEPLPATIS